MAQANIKAVITAEDRASAALRGFGNNVEKTSNRMNSALRTVAKAGLAAVAAGLAAVASRVDDAVKRIDTLVQFPKVLQAMGVSAGKARAATEALSKELQGLPTPLQEGAAGVQRFVAAGLGVGKSTKLFLAMNNALIAGGANAQDVQVSMDGMIRAISAGEVPASTLTAMLSRMPTVMAALTEKTGKSQDQLQKLFEKDPSKLVNHLIELNEKGGGGLASLEKQAREATGGIGTAFSNMGNAIDRGLQSIVTSLGGGDLERGQQRISGAITNVGKAFENALKSIGAFIPKLVELGQKVGDNLSPKLNALWNTISTKLLPALNNLWKNVIQPLIPVIGTALVAAVGLAIDAVNLMILAITPLVNWLGQNKDAVYAVIGALIAYKVALIIGGAANAFIGSVRGMIGILNIYRTQGLASAITSTKIFQALVRAPISMPALAVGAALGSIYLVFKAVKAVTGAINAMNNAAAAQNAEIQNSSRAIESIQASIKRARKAGDQNKVRREQQRLRDFTSQQGFATGGFTGRGNTNQIAGVVHKGEFVIPKNMVDQNRGLPKSNSDQVNITIQAGAFMGSQQDARKYAEMIFRAYADLVKANPSKAVI